MLTLKKVDSKSAELLSKLSVKTFVDAYENVHSKSNMDSYCREHYSEAMTRSLLNSPEVEAFVAFQGNESAGFYVIKHHACPVELNDQSTELKQLYVLSGYYGEGLGKELLENAVDRCLEQGSKWLWLCVSDANFRAQKFYQKIGFTKIGDGPLLIVGSDELTSSIMALEVRRGGQSNV